MGAGGGGGVMAMPIVRNVTDPVTGQVVTESEMQARQHHRDLQAQGLNDDGSPVRPKYQSELDPATGQMRDDLKLHWGQDVKADQTALNEIRKRALDTGDSSWAKMAMQKQGIEETGAKSQAEQQANSARSSAQSQMASTYGLSPAAQERLAMQGSRDLMNAQQNVGFQGQKARADIGLQDQNQKNQFLGMVPQYDMQNANLALQNKTGSLQADSVNIGNTMKENQNTNQMALEAYKSEMEKWAAGKQADATRSSGGGGKK